MSLTAQHLGSIRTNRRVALIAAALAWAGLCPQPAAAERTALLLNTDNLTAWRVVRADVERYGGRVLTVCPPQLMIVDVDAAIVPHLTRTRPVQTASVGVIKAESNMSVSARAGIAFWNARLNGGSQTEADKPDGQLLDFADDVFLPPDIPADLLERYEFVGFRTAEEEAQARGHGGLRGLSGVGTSTYYTSAFMLGEIVIGAILPDSNGVIDADVEDWTESEVSAIHSRIITAMTRFQEDCPIADITLIFHWDDAPGTGGVAGTIDCDYEAITNTSQARADALSRLSYAGAPGTRDYANHLRNLYDADWAFYFCVADNSVTGGGRAYAYLGGPLSQCYGHNSSSVFQHETGHIFNAIDEYHPDAARSPTARWGYQQVVNANSQYNDGTGFNGGAGEGQSALMVNNINKHSAYSTGQIGWYDSDGDGILDISDSFPAVSVQLDSLVDGVAAFSGQATVSYVRSQQSGFGVGFSVNELTSVEWRLAGQTWQPATPTDGVLDTGVEDITFAVGPLPNGDYTIETRATHNLGNTTILPTELDLSVTNSVVADAAPFASFEVNPPVQRVGYDVVFDAGACGDLETSSNGLEVRWDWDSDGTWDTAYDTGRTIIHAFASAGPHDVTLQVKDTLGQTATIEHEVLISTDNLAPTVALEVTTGNIHGEFQPTYTFDATGTFDPEGGVVEIRWDWDANGSFDTGYSTDMVGNHMYTLSTSEGGKSAQWTVVMQARDADGAVTEVSREIWSCPYNDPPQISAFVNPSVASTDTTIIFDASASTDANFSETWDGLLEFRFDWDGDGNWDTDMLPNPVELHNYPETGTYHPRVQVRDRFSALDETVLEVVVQSEPVEQPFIVTGATLTPSWMQVAPNTDFQMNLSLEYLGIPGPDDLSATWYVSNIEGGDATVGTITTNGLYTSPAETGYRQIRAVSNSNASIYATASISTATDFVMIYPDWIELVEGQTGEFQVSTGFSVDPTVTWYVNDIQGGHPLLGLIDSNGLMQAPASVFGEYSVTVKAVSNENPDVYGTATATLRSANPPSADFHASIIVGDAPLTTEFTAITSNGVIQWDWDFGDGTRDVGETVEHEYTEPGLYTVSLDVIAPGGATGETKVAYIQVNGGTAPLVDFGTGMNPVSPWDIVVFTSAVVGDVDTYAWDFGGIATDAQSNGVWTRPSEGLHTIALTVTGPGGSATKTKPDYLQVTQNPWATVDFLVYGETSGTAPLEVEFVPIPSMAVCAYDWDFGDPYDPSGIGTNGPNPTHTYSVPGLYTVALEVALGEGTASGGCGDGGQPGGYYQTASVTKVDLIEVLAAPGDCTEDGQIDLDDLVCFEACLDGPNNELTAGCELVDFDGDDNVDLADFASFQSVYGTP